MFNFLKKTNTDLGEPVIEKPKTIKIGKTKITLDKSVKQEEKYIKKYKADIDEVDVAVAKQLLQKGDVVLDVGASIGYVALHYLDKGAKEVHSFEPHPQIYKRLKNIKRKGLVTYPVALSNKRGKCSLIISQSHNQGSTLEKKIAKGNRNVFGAELQKVKISTDKLDHVFPDKYFDFVKVDIEGHELAFLKGAKKFLKKRAPRIFQIEIQDKDKDQVISLLQSSYKNVRRVDYNKKTGQVNFAKLEETCLPEYEHSPQNYIFTNEDV